MSCLDSLLVYFMEEFHSLQLIVLVVFVAVDVPLACCMLVHFLEIKFEVIVDLSVCPCVYVSIMSLSAR